MNTKEIKLPPFPEGLCLREDIEDYAREAVRLNMPPGWKLVPVEPTPEMIVASRLDIPCRCGEYEAVTYITLQQYDAMLAAAPAAPQPAQAQQPVSEADELLAFTDHATQPAQQEREANPLLARNGRLEAELAEVRADAERYRWLRDRWGRVTDTYDGDSGRVVEIGTEPDGEGWDVDAPSLDAAIDAALAQQEPPHA